MPEVPRPPDTLMRDREIAFAEVERRLRPWLRPDGLRVSPLGPGYSSDIDAYVRHAPDPSELAAAGWLPLDRLLASVGIRQQGCWAVVVEGRVVGCADIYESAPPDPVRHVLDKCRRRGAGPRELAELDVLRDQGHVVGAIPARRATAGLRDVVRSVRGRARPRIVLAISGVDGAGKTTLTQRVVDDLAKAGVPASRIWARPGVTGAALDRVARAVKRLLREDPGFTRAAAGGATSLRSRQGLLGRVWSSLILVDFAAEVLRRFARAQGVVVFDRHLIDAQVTFRVMYPGQRDLAWGIASRVIPKADFMFHIDVPADVALARKPGEPMGDWAVRRQIEEYTRAVGEGVTVLDGQEHPDRLALRVLEHLTRGPHR